MNKLLNNLLGMYKQAKLNKKAEEKESAKKDYTEQYAKVKEIMKEYGYGLSDGGYIYLISKEQPKDEGFQVKFKGDRLRVELDGKLKYSGYGPEAIEEFLKGMFYAKKLSSKNTKLTKKAGWKVLTPKDLTEEVKDEFLKDSIKEYAGHVKGEDFYFVKGIKEKEDDQFSYDWEEGMFGEWRTNVKGEVWYSLTDLGDDWDYIYLIKEDKLYKMPNRESLTDFGVVSSKRVKLTKKAMRKKAFRKLCLKRAFHKTAGEFEEMMKLKSTDPKLISYLAKEFGVEESTVSQYTDVSENAEELYNILEQQANKYGYEWDKFEYDEYGDRIDEDDFRGDPDDLDKAVEYLKNNIDKSMFKFEYVGTYEENYLTFSVNEKLIPIEKPIIYITNDTKNYDISLFIQTQKSKEEDKAEGIETENHLTILIRRTSDEILNEIVNYVNVELPKKVAEQNTKQSSKNQKLQRKAMFNFNADVLEISEKQLEQIRDTAKDMGDEIWAKINGKIEKIIAYGYDNGKLKIVYREPYYGEEEIQEMYDNADEVEYIDFETLELKKQSSKAKLVRKQAIRTFDQAIKDDLLKGNKTWEDAGKDIRDSGWSSFSLDKEGTIEMLKLTEEEIAKIDSLQQTAKEKKQIAEEYTKQYYAGKFDWETLHDKLVKIFGDVGTAFEWLRDNDVKIKRSSSTKKQAEGKKYYAVAESGTNFGSNDNKEDLKEEIRDFVVAHKDNFEKKEKIYLKESDTDKTIEEIIVRDILTPYGSKKWVIVATKKQATKFLVKFIVNGETYKKESIRDNFIEATKDAFNKIKTTITKDKIDSLPNELSPWTINDFDDIEVREIDGYGVLTSPKYTKEDIKENLYKKASNIKIAKKETNKQATIKHENGVYNVYSESGKCLGKGYKTKEEAEKRLKQVEYFKNKKAVTGTDYWGPKEIPDEEEEGTFIIRYYGGPGHIDYLRKSRNGKYHWVEQTHFDYINDKPFETTDYELAKKLVEQYGGEIEKKESKQVNNKRTSLKQVVISKMAKNLKDIPDSVKKNILSDLVYVILTGKGSFAYKTVAKKLETIIKDLGYGDRLKANEDGSLPTNEIVELISKEPKAMELAGKFANVTKTF